MTDADRDALQIVVSSDVVMRALRKCFHEATVEHLPEIEGGNELIGERYRAYVKAQSIIATAFDTLETCTKERSKNKEDISHI